MKLTLQRNGKTLAELNLERPESNFQKMMKAQAEAMFYLTSAEAMNNSTPAEWERTHPEQPLTFAQLHPIADKLLSMKTMDWLTVAFFTFLVSCSIGVGMMLIAIAIAMLTNLHNPAFWSAGN